MYLGSFNYWSVYKWSCGGGMMGCRICLNCGICGICVISFFLHPFFCALWLHEVHIEGQRAMLFFLCVLCALCGFFALCNCTGFREAPGI